LITPGRYRLMPGIIAALTDALGRRVSDLIGSLGGVRPAPAPPARFSRRSRGDREAAQGDQLTLV